MRSVAYAHPPRLAAHLTIFDVVLVVTTARVEDDGVLFATVRADDDPGRIGRPVAERKLLIEVVEEIDHVPNQRASSLATLHSIYTWNIQSMHRHAT